MTISNKYTGPHDFSGATVVGIGGGTTLFEGAVGPGETYATISGAVEAGLTRLLITGDTTELADTAIPTGGMYLHIVDGATVNMGNFSLARDINAANLMIRGQGTMVFAHTSVRAMFPANGAYDQDSITDIEGISIVNNSTADFCMLSTTVERINSVTLTCANKQYGGISSNQDGCSYTNIHMIGGGSQCRLSFVTGNGRTSVTDNIAFTGTYITPSTSVYNMQANGGTFNNFYFETAGTFKILLTGSKPVLSNVTAVDQSVDIQVDADNVTISNVQLNGGDIVPRDHNFLNASNVNGGGFIDAGPFLNSDKNTFTSCRFSSESKIVGAKNKLTGCNFDGGLILDSTSDTAMVNGCEIAGTGIPILGDSNYMTGSIIDGDVLVNGASNTLNGCTINGTLLITAAASGTMIADCRYDAISDAGTDTLVTASVEF